MNESWRKSLDREIPLSFQEWLKYKGSFMQRLLEFGIANAEITVLDESWQQPWDTECHLLKLAEHETALVREVIIFSRDKRWMFARTVFPREILKGQYECLAQLKNRSLGSVLFKDPDMQRSEFEFIAVQPPMQLYTKVTRAAPEIRAASLLTRRSVFTLHSHSLLLTEVFLPDLALL